MSERHIIRVRKAQGRSSSPQGGLGIKLPSDWVTKTGLAFDDLIITVEEDGWLKLSPLKDKELLKFARDLGAVPERGRPQTRKMPAIATTKAEKP